jgi:hypothetical protein
VSRRPLTPGQHAARVTVSAPAAEVERAHALARAAGFRTMSAWTRHLWAGAAVPMDGPPPPTDDDFTLPAEEQPYIQGGQRLAGAHEEIEVHAPDPRDK